jgi:hypothetical protein
MVFFSLLFFFNYFHKIEDVPKNAILRARDNDEIRKARFIEGKNYNITNHTMGHNVHELNCIAYVAVRHYPRYEYDQKLMERLEEEEEKVNNTN